MAAQQCNSLPHFLTQQDQHPAARPGAGRYPVRSSTPVSLARRLAWTVDRDAAGEPYQGSTTYQAALEALDVWRLAYGGGGAAVWAAVWAWYDALPVRRVDEPGWLAPAFAAIGAGPGPAGRSGRAA